jgi:ABC-type polysaccharide/polyol phosphate transport system ATPase subunit
MENVEKFCDRAIMIDNGEIVADGDPKKVAKKYLDLFKK